MVFKWFNLAKRLSEVEDMLLTFAKRQDELELDYGELRARCKRLLDRTEKAASRLVQSQDSGQPEADVAVPEANSGGNGRLLTYKQRILQQQILRRRAGV